MTVKRATTIVVIAGAPGAGKSSVAQALQAVLKCPLFEFGWIPEFRNTGDRELAYVEEEALAFENLVLVTKNYAAHGFRWVILTDLQAPYVARIHQVFNGYDHRTFTLRQADENVVRARVLEETRSSDYRDDATAIARNHDLHRRAAYPSEQFIDVGTRPVHDILDTILDHLSVQTWDRVIKGGLA